MQRIAFLMKLKPGNEAEYLRRHAEIWPEMAATLKQAGIRNYNIFRNDLQLFAYLEVEDFKYMTEYLAQDPTAARWEESMKDLIEREVEPEHNFPALLPQMFHLD
ncbi:MAG: putative rhamnose mutarotase RhaM [Chloroflexi bacterium]|jgi:L-rhamnose mutarotase|nr:putative rhamnose mutarotase RhaM [Chloroflexota bacterium]